MKAKELMLDDLVYGLYPNGKRYPHPFRIAAVDIYPTNKSPRIVTVGGYGFQEEHLAPIPLTPDILEKNGFKRKDDGITLVYKDGFEICVYFYQVHIEGEIYNDILISIAFAEKDMCMPIEYVHELQHALRLFGVEKEIEL